MPAKYYDVDVRKVDIGHIVVRANSPEEAKRMIERGDYKGIKSEFWNSVKLTALSASIAEVVPARLIGKNEIEEDFDTEELF